MFPPLDEDSSSRANSTKTSPTDSATAQIASEPVTSAPNTSNYQLQQFTMPLTSSQSKIEQNENEKLNTNINTNNVPVATASSSSSSSIDSTIRTDPSNTSISSCYYETQSEQSSEHTVAIHSADSFHPQPQSQVLQPTSDSFDATMYVDNVDSSTPHFDPNSYSTHGLYTAQQHAAGSINLIPSNNSSQFSQPYSSAQFNSMGNYGAYQTTQSIDSTRQRSEPLLNSFNFNWNEDGNMRQQSYSDMNAYMFNSSHQNVNSSGLNPSLSDYTSGNRARSSTYPRNELKQRMGAGAKPAARQFGNRVHMFTLPQTCVLPLDLRPYSHLYAYGGLGGYPYSHPSALKYAYVDKAHGGAGISVYDPQDHTAQAMQAKVYYNRRRSGTSKSDKSNTVSSSGSMSTGRLLSNAPVASAAPVTPVCQSLQSSATTASSAPSSLQSSPPPPPPLLSTVPPTSSPVSMMSMAAPDPIASMQMYSSFSSGYNMLSSYTPGLTPSPVPIAPMPQISQMTQMSAMSASPYPTSIQISGLGPVASVTSHGYITTPIVSSPYEPSQPAIAGVGSGSGTGTGTSSHSRHSNVPTKPKSAVPTATILTQPFSTAPASAPALASAPQPVASTTSMSVSAIGVVDIPPVSSTHPTTTLSNQQSQSTIPSSNTHPNGSIPSSPRT